MIDNEVWARLDMVDTHGTDYRPFERWNQLSPSEEEGEQEFKNVEVDD